MFVFVVRRLAVIPPLLVAASFILFCLLHLAPGDPEELLLGVRQADPATLAAAREAYHLDEPFLAQYWHWLSGVATGDLGESISSRDTVANVVAPRVLPTLQLALYAFVLVFTFGVTFGVVAAVRRGKVLDQVVSSGTLVGAAASPYLIGILLLVAFSAELGWFPLLGLGDGGLDRLYHLTLPAIALAVSLTALVMRTCRASLIAVLDSEYIEVARSRGFSERRVVLKHALRNALIPVLTISGLVFGFLITGTVFVEYTFGLGGLGSLLVEAVQARDFPVVQALAMIFAAGFLVISLVVDVLYAVVDPRIRLSSTGR